MKDMKLRLFRLGFALSVALLFGFVFFTWVTIKINDLIFYLPDSIGVVGTIVSGVLSVVFLKKYFDRNRQIWDEQKTVKLNKTQKS